IARIAHELGRLVETHRLAVEDGGAENVRIMALDPGRGVDEQGKARRVTFGKAVFAETFDLVETAFGEIAPIPAACHALGELPFEEMDGAVMAEGRHGAS